MVLAVAGGTLFLAMKTRAVRRTAEAARAVQMQRLVRLAVEMEKNEEQLAAVVSEQERVKAPLAGVARNASTVSKPTRSAPALPPDIERFRNAMATDPRIQNIHLANRRSHYEEDYRALADRLKLTDAQVGQLVDNLMKHYEQQLDLGVALEAQGFTDQATWAKMREGAADSFRAQQVALLGETGYAAFEVYARTLPLRQFVDRVAGRAAVAGIPLTSAQGDALIDALAEASPTYRQGVAATIQGIDWDGALARAATELPAAQFALFRNAAIPLRNMDRLKELAQKK